MWICLIAPHEYTKREGRRRSPGKAAIYRRSGTEVTGTMGAPRALSRQARRLPEAEEYDMSLTYRTPQVGCINPTLGERRYSVERTTERSSNRCSGSKHETRRKRSRLLARRQEVVSETLAPTEDTGVDPQRNRIVEVNGSIQGFR